MHTQPTSNNPMKRGEFLRNLGLSSAALMAYYCLGTTLTACGGSSDDDDPTPTPGTTTGLTGNADTSKGAINFTLDLTNSTYSKLKTEGEFAKIGSVLVARVKGGNYVTIQRLCTHQAQDAVAYRLASNDFMCSAHGSVFATDGSVKTAVESGQSAMKLYKTTVSADGNTLTITA